MSASELRSSAASMRSEASDAVSKGNALNDQGDRDGAQEYWHHASQLETIARLYEERANQEENAAR